MMLADRLPTLETEALRNLQANALRLAAETGMRGKEAEALLPLIEAELSQRVPTAPPKKARAAKKK